MVPPLFVLKLTLYFGSRLRPMCITLLQEGLMIVYAALPLNQIAVGTVTAKASVEMRSMDAASDSAVW